MSTKVNKKNIIGIAGTLALGIIGSALWEKLFRNLFNFSSDFILNLISLGFESLKNQIFVEVSKGFHEYPSLQVSLMFNGIFCGAVFSTLMIKHRIDKIKNRKLSSTTQTSKISKILISNGFLYPYVIFGVVFLTFMSVRIAYVNRVVSYNNYLFNLNAPYIDQHQALLLKLQFSQIQSQNDYLDLINKMKVTAKENGVKVTEFNKY